MCYASDNILLFVCESYCKFWIHYKTQKYGFCFVMSSEYFNVIRKPAVVFYPYNSYYKQNYFL